MTGIDVQIQDDETVDVNADGDADTAVLSPGSSLTAQISNTAADAQLDELDALEASISEGFSPQVQITDGQDINLSIEDGGTVVSAENNGSLLGPVNVLNFNDFLDASLSNGKLTINADVPAQYTDEDAQDAVGNILTGAGSVTVDYDDANDTITITGTTDTTDDFVDKDVQSADVVTVPDRESLVIAGDRKVNGVMKVNGEVKVV